MPQLDVIAYISEVTWFSLIFVVLYFYVLSRGLVNIHKILKFRKYLLQLVRTDIQHIVREIYYYDLSIKIFFLGYIVSSKEVYEGSIKKVDILVEVLSLKVLRYVDKLFILNKLSFSNNNIYDSMEAASVTNSLKYITGK